VGDPGPGSSRPVLIVVAGPNGSGKTSLKSQVLSHRWIHGCTYVNPDNIARDMFGDWNSTSAVLDAAKHAEALPICAVKPRPSALARSAQSRRRRICAGI
jgi:predicted ABC-type ATPase